MRLYRWGLAVGLALSLLLPAAPAAARHALTRHVRAKHHHVVAGGWDGRWAGAWGGNDPTAINIQGGHVVSYEYGGQTTPVSSSRVTATRVVYGEADRVVTMTRTGNNTAHATIKSSQGNGAAELTRQ